MQSNPTATQIKLGRKCGAGSHQKWAWLVREERGRRIKWTFVDGIRKLLDVVCDPSIICNTGWSTLLNPDPWLQC